MTGSIAGAAGDDGAFRALLALRWAACVGKWCGFFLLFNLYYCQRTFVFPLLIRGHGTMPLSIILFGMIFNTANAYMQGTWIFVLSPDTLYTPAWLHTPQFISGAVIFLNGDLLLRNAAGDQPGAQVIVHVEADRGRSAWGETYPCVHLLGSSLSVISRLRTRS